MILKTIKITTILFLISNNNLFSQESAQFKNLLNQAFPTNQLARKTQKAPDTSSEAQLFMTGLFKFYKHTISSQDSRKCTFYPSCSEYGIIAFKEYGLKGIFYTFDRLSRCNGLNHKHYPFDNKNNLLFDPVKPDSTFYLKLGKNYYE